jgi:transposase-like protein
MKTKNTECRRSHRYPFEFRFEVVQLHLQEGYPVGLLSEQFSIS